MTGISAPVQIVRDARDIPHITARSDRDLFFAQGYAEGSDRLFQMDLIRRFVRGRLSEVLGSTTLAADEHARIVPIDDIVANEWAHLNASSRDELQAFSDGVNAARERQPLPAEFRLLLYKPEPWTPQDSLAAGFATVLDLIDRWDDVVRRDNVAHSGVSSAADLYSITDPQYDAPVAGAAIAAVPKLAPKRPVADTAPAAAANGDSYRFASNAWALGASHSKTGHALLANDPHLRLGIPGVWYLVELRSPRLHVAGVTLAGVPGVILGHNDRIAWGATNGTVVTEVVYRESMRNASTRTETFHVRFGKDVTKTYLSTQRGFVIDKDRGLAVDWNAVRIPRSPLEAFEDLDRAQSIGAAIEALRRYPGPPQNFVLASSDGTAAYHLAGLIPNDPSWGMRVHDERDPVYPFVPFDALPHVDASRSARVFTANNRTYGAGYPYRLSANFAAPYRAKRIEQLLDAFPKADVNDLFAMQSDTLSLPEKELAADIVRAVKRKGAQRDRDIAGVIGALARWDGRFSSSSTVAPLVYDMRLRLTSRLASWNAGAAAQDYLASAQNADFVLLMRVLRERPRGWWRGDDYDGLLVETLREALREKRWAGTAWHTAGEVAVKHPLSALGFTFLNGGTLPGLGDAYSIHVQTDEPHSQSFRAVWDVGNWDAGGIIIPSGESGEEGSGHYTDLRADWLGARLQPLPFSTKAVAAAAKERLTLVPAPKT